MRTDQWGSGSLAGSIAGAFLAFLIFTGSLWADPTITARVSSNQISLDNSVTLTIDISGIANLRDAPDLNLPDFQVQRAGQTQSYQWVNGQSSSMISFNYVLTPTKTGTLTIPPITLQSDGKSYSTQPLTIVVGASSGSASSGPAPGGGGGETPSRSAAVPSEGLKPVFMTANVDKSKAYVGQQILLTVQFLRRPNVNLGAQPRYREPDMTGFLVEPLKQQEFNTNLNGIPYVVTELRYALFPTSDGDFAIGNANIDAVIRTPWDPFDPNSIFQNFLNQGQVIKLTTRAIPIQVRALPKNKPEGFSGSVGRFKLTAKVDTTEPEVGKPLNLIIKVEGIGNIKAVREPSLPELRSFRRYETISNSKVNNEGKFIYGSKEFKILLIPQVSGSLAIPSIAFSYFNPDEHQFITDATPAIPLQVKPGTLASSNQDQQTPYATSDVNEEGIRVVEKDIRFIKSGKIRPIRGPLATHTGYWILNMIPPLFALGALIAVFRTRRRSENVGFYRSKEAFRKVKKGLKQTQKLLVQPDSTKFYGTLYSVLVGYLADKLSLAASGVIWQDIEERLVEKGVEAELRTKVREIWDETDMARFGITTFSVEEKRMSLKKTEEVLTLLNKIL